MGARVKFSSGSRESREQIRELQRSWRQGSHVNSGGRPLPEKARVVLEQQVEKEKRGGWSSGWQARKLRLVDQSSCEGLGDGMKQVLEYFEDGRWASANSGEIFDLCKDDAVVEAAPEKAPGAFRVRVINHPYPAYAFRVPGTNLDAAYRATRWVEDISKAIESCGHNEEFIKVEDLAKSTHKMFGAGWVQRRLILRLRKEAPFVVLEYFDVQKLDDVTQFAICEDHVRVEKANDVEVGAWKIHVHGHPYKEYTFCLRDTVITNAHRSQQEWVEEIGKQVAQCQQSVAEPPRWYLPAKMEFRFVACHMRNLQTYIEYNSELVNLARSYGRGAWDAVELHENALNIKSGLLKAQRKIGPMAQGLKERLEFDSGWTPHPYNPENCMDDADMGEIEAQDKRELMAVTKMGKESAEYKEIRNRLVTETNLLAQAQQKILDGAEQLEEMTRLKVATETNLKVAQQRIEENTKETFRLEARIADCGSEKGVLQEKIKELELEVARLKEEAKSAGTKQDTPKPEASTGRPVHPLAAMLGNKKPADGENSSQASTGRPVHPLAAMLGNKQPKTSEVEEDEPAKPAVHPLAALLAGKGKGATGPPVPGKGKGGKGAPPPPVPGKGKGGKGAPPPPIAGKGKGGPVPPPPPATGKGGPGAAVPLPPGPKKDPLTLKGEAILDAQQALAPAVILPPAKVDEKSILDLLDTDRGSRAVMARANGGTNNTADEEETTTTLAPTQKKKEKYEMPFVGEKVLQWSISMASVDTAVKEAGADGYTDLVDRVFNADPDTIGKFEDAEVPGLMGRLEVMLGDLTSEYIVQAKNDPMIAAMRANEPAFTDSYNGLTKLSEFIVAIAAHSAKNPKMMFACMADRWKWKKTLGEIGAQLKHKQEFYESGDPQSLITALDGAISNEVCVIMRETVQESKLKAKKVSAKSEYTYMERNFREKAASRPHKMNWIPHDRQDAVVPLLYMLNVLNNGDKFIVAKALKDKEKTDGLWSPTHVDLLLAFAQKNKPSPGGATYLSQIKEACSKMTAWNPYSQSSFGLGSQIHVANQLKTSLGTCKEMAERSFKERIAAGEVIPLMQDFNKVEAMVTETLEELEDLEKKVYVAIGPVAGRLCPNGAGNGTLPFPGAPQWTKEVNYEEITKQARAFASNEIMGSGEKKGDTPEATVERVYEPRGIFDDYTLQRGLLAFCDQVSERVGKVGKFYTDS